MRGVNKAVLIGNLGKDPEIQYIDGKIPVVKFPLATTEMFKDKNGVQQSETDWHNIVLWRGLAELAAKYIKKGSAVYIEGKIKTRSYEDKEGKLKFITEIIGEEMILLDKKNPSASEGEHKE